MRLGFCLSLRVGGWIFDVWRLPRIQTVGLLYRLLYNQSRQSPFPGPRQIFTARKEIILAGGAFGTPQILLNSGIGNRHDLASVGVPVVHDLPNVGKNMADHAAIVWEAQSNIPVPAWQPTCVQTAK